MDVEKLVEFLEKSIEDYEEILRKKRISIKKINTLIAKYKDDEITDNEIKELEKLYKRVKNAIEKIEKERKQTRLTAFFKNS